MPLITIALYTSPISSAITPIVYVLRRRSVRAKKLGRYFSVCAASMMRFFVCSGMERDAGELFRAAETVPGVSPRCSAMVFRVTLSSLRGPDFFLGGGVIFRTFVHLPKLGYVQWRDPA